MTRSILLLFLMAFLYGHVQTVRGTVEKKDKNLSGQMQIEKELKEKAPLVLNVV